ncbi:MAG: hypothetical protein PVJ39_21535 [Gammaproteobacteria bacterium]|jgi:hypothetical protein
MLQFFLNIVFSLIFTAFFLWLGMKLMQVYTGAGWSGSYCSFWELLIATAASAIVGELPYVGLVLSWVVLFWLLLKFTEANIGEVIIMVIFSKVIAFFVLLYLGLVT